MNWQLKVLPRAEEFLWGCPPRVQRLMTDISESVALSGPTRFSGGGYWEAMHGTMRGWFEILLFYFNFVRQKTLFDMRIKLFKNVL